MSPEHSSSDPNHSYADRTGPLDAEPPDDHLMGETTVASENSTPESQTVGATSSSPDLVVLDEEDWANEVAQHLVDRLEIHPTARICLPTGQTPRPMYAACAPSLDVAKATIFLLDEFGLPASSPGRCDSMLQRDLLGKLERPPRKYHRLHVDADLPDAECARFDTLVEDGGLDLTLLGIGGNGHLGLNEPGTEADSPTRTVDLAPSTVKSVRGYDAEAHAVGGMTLGLRRILESNEIWLLVTGSRKAIILEQMLTGPVGPDLPASFLRNHPNTIIYADRSAASLL